MRQRLRRHQESSKVKTLLKKIAQNLLFEQRYARNKEGIHDAQIDGVMIAPLCGHQNPFEFEYKVAVSRAEICFGGYLRKRG
jgi:hypothetical protein